MDIAQYGLTTLKECPRQRVPPHAYFVVSAVFHYLGPSFAVLLFARVEVLGVAWLRIASAALIFAFWRRPWRAFAALDRDGRRLLAGLGLRPGADELLLLSRDQPAAAGDGRGDRVPAGRRPGGAGRAHAPQPRSARARGARGLSRDRRPDRRSSRSASRSRSPTPSSSRSTSCLPIASPSASALSGIDGLAASMLIAAVVVTPLAGWAAIPALGSPLALAAGVGVGVSSSVIPYVTDQLALARLARATYALMVSLLPAIATVIGVVVLTQIPSRLGGRGRRPRRRRRRVAPGRRARYTCHRQVIR